MAKILTCAERRCSAEFRVGFVEGLLGRPKYCKRCRKGFLLSPADRMRADGMGEFIVAPWTNTQTMFRPVMFDQHTLGPAKMAERAALLAPTASEAEALRRAMILASVDQVRATAAANAVASLHEARAGGDVIDGEAIPGPGPDTGGSWSDVDLAVPLDDLRGVA